MLPDLGEIESVWVQIDRSGERSGWYLGTVTVKDKKFEYWGWIEDTELHQLKPS